MLTTIMTRDTESKNVLFPIRTVACHEQVDMVAGDLHGAAWRKKSVDIQQCDSTIEEAFANANLPIPHGPKPLLGPSGAPSARDKKKRTPPFDESRSRAVAAASLRIFALIRRKADDEKTPSKVRQENPW